MTKVAGRREEFLKLTAASAVLRIRGARSSHLGTEIEKLARGHEEIVLKHFRGGEGETRATYKIG